MSQFLSNKYLRYRDITRGGPAQFLDQDTPCRKCSYNLRGLTSDGKCPECGTAIRNTPPAHHSLLSEAPLAEIRRLNFGLWLGVSFLACMPALLVFTFATLPMRQLGVIAACWWLAAVWSMTPELQSAEGVKRGFVSGNMLRLFSRASQVCWLAVSIALVALPAGTARLAAVLGLVMCALAGLVALAVMLIRLADWMCDEFAEKLLNWTIWILPSSTGMLLLMPVFSVLWLFACGVTLLWASAIIVFGLAMLSLALSSSWSMRHAQDRLEREQAERERIVARPPPPPPSNEPIKLAEPGDPVPILAGGAQLPSMDDILRDVPCHHCGYNLRGLKVRGKCPECGEQIAGA